MDLNQKLDLIELPPDLVEYSKQCIISQFPALKVLTIIYEWLPAINNIDKPCINPTKIDAYELSTKLLKHCQCSDELRNILSDISLPRNLTCHPSKKSLQKLQELKITVSEYFEKLYEALRIAGREATPVCSPEAVQIQIDDLAAKFKNPLEVFSKFSNEAVQLPGPSLSDEAEILNSSNSPSIDAVPYEKKECLNLMGKITNAEEFNEDEIEDATVNVVDVPPNTCTGNNANAVKEQCKRVENAVYNTEFLKP